MLSLAPAPTTEGLFGSPPTAGSFCLFCEKMSGGLPTVTSVPVTGASLTGALAAGLAMAVPAPASTTHNTAPAAANLGARIGPPSSQRAVRISPALSVSGPPRFGQLHKRVPRLGRAPGPHGMNP